MTLPSAPYVGQALHRVEEAAMSGFQKMKDVPGSMAIRQHGYDAIDEDRAPRQDDIGETTALLAHAGSLSSVPGNPASEHMTAGNSSTEEKLST